MCLNAISACADVSVLFSLFSRSFWNNLSFTYHGSPVTYSPDELLRLANQEVRKLWDSIPVTSFHSGVFRSEFKPYQIKSFSDWLRITRSLVNRVENVIDSDYQPANEQLNIHLLVGHQHVLVDDANRYSYSLYHMSSIVSTGQRLFDQVRQLLYVTDVMDHLINDDNFHGLSFQLRAIIVMEHLYYQLEQNNDRYIIHHPNVLVSAPPTLQQLALGSYIKDRDRYEPRTEFAYSSFGKELEEYWKSNNNKPTEQQVIDYVRDIISGGTKYFRDYKDFPRFVNIVVALFMCEVSRAPSTLLCSLMLLDLIEDCANFPSIFDDNNSFL